MHLTRLPLDRIHPDPDNIRDSAHDADIEALAADIKIRGLLQPIVVYEAHEDDGVSPGHFIIAAGHRRFFALLSLGLTSTNANVRDHPTGELDRLDLMWSENGHRRQLNPIEEAKLYRRYERSGQTQADIARRLLVTQPRVSDYLLLLTLSRDVQRRLIDGQITVNAAKKLARAARHSAGNARPDYGGQHRVGFAVPYFTSNHPLYQNAAARCRELDHDPALRIGAACGECWERTIRLDAAKSPVRVNDPTPVPRPRRQVERFADPREILRRVKCTRCEVGALESPNERRCVVLRGDRRVLFDRHEFPMEVSASA